MSKLSPAIQRLALVILCIGLAAGAVRLLWIAEPNSGLAETTSATLSLPDLVVLAPINDQTATADELSLPTEPIAILAEPEDNKTVFNVSIETKTESTSSDPIADAIHSDAVRWESQPEPKYEIADDSNPIGVENTEADPEATGIENDVVDAIRDDASQNLEDKSRENGTVTDESVAAQSLEIENQSESGSMSSESNPYGKLEPVDTSTQQIPIQIAQLPNWQDVEHTASPHQSQTPITIDQLPSLHSAGENAIEPTYIPTSDSSASPQELPLISVSQTTVTTENQSQNSVSIEPSDSQTSVQASNVAAADFLDANSSSENQLAQESAKPGSSDNFIADPVQKASLSTSTASSSSMANPPVNSHVTKAPTPTSSHPATPKSAPSVLANSNSFVLAEQPQLGDHWKDDRPIIDRRAVLGDSIKSDFSPDPIQHDLPYAPYHQMEIYEGKTLNATQRPILELGRPWYQLGQLKPPSYRLGKHNPTQHQFLIYGDVRHAIASNHQNGDGTTQTAHEVNLDFDWQITATERFHMFMAPLDDGTTNTGYVFDDDEWTEQFDANIDFGYFEGDLGAIVGGFTGDTLPFDFPFAMGVMPLVLQNGVWMEDAFLGVAATIPARNSARFGISNMDTTFFAGYDKINSPAFVGDDSAARMYGIASFIDALNGYIEADYAFLEDRTVANRSYHNFGLGYTRRYGRWISNSTRIIVNGGQESDVVANTADGVLLLSENSLITGAPSTLVPYFNFFAGYDRPQSAARAAQAGGILRNTGILFESDGMTNYPTLDATANDTWGGALGLNLLACDFSQQLIVEMAWLNVMGNDLNRNAADDQYGIAMRYQLPLTNAIIFRTDAMIGFLDDAEDVHGVRMELRKKY